MHRKFLFMTVTSVIGFLLSTFIMGQAIAQGPSSEIGAKQVTTHIKGHSWHLVTAILCGSPFDAVRVQQVFARRGARSLYVIYGIERKARDE